MSHHKLLERRLNSFDPEPNIWISWGLYAPVLAPNTSLSSLSTSYLFFLSDWILSLIFCKLAVAFLLSGTSSIVFAARIILTFPGSARLIVNFNLSAPAYSEYYNLTISFLFNVFWAIFWKILSVSFPAPEPGAVNLLLRSLS